MRKTFCGEGNPLIWKVEPSVAKDFIPFGMKSFATEGFTRFGMRLWLKS
jgi:hypothetical protein